jgi:tRNA(Ile)-lysidine synthase
MRVNPADDTPLAADCFAPLMAQFEPFESRPVLAVGVSGGRDSLALTLLAHDWVAQRGGRVLGLIVDHGLRAEAAHEAAETRARLGDLGIAAEILRWTGPKPKPAHGIQAAAREARYRLLLAACRRHGILHLLVAHHADDQAETVAMRAARGSGPDGLAGMAALVEHAEVRLLRPLLDVRRNRLAATLRARGVPWIDDPSNVDPRFERARLRKIEGPIRGPASGRASDRAARERELARLAVETVEFDGKVAAIDWKVLRQIRPTVGALLLSRIVQALGGRDHPPRRDRLARATARLLRAGPGGKSGKSQDFTFSECRLMLRQGSDGRRLRWIVSPENGKKIRRNPGQPLIPAAFFACGGGLKPHVQ